jgi:transposase
MKKEIQIDVQEIDHLGIIDEIGIVEIIDKELGTHSQEKVSAGKVVKAMIINCMGFLTAPLFLFSEFFRRKATEHLIGEGIKAEYLNESRLGRVLEQLYEYGVSLLFIKIAFVMVERFGIKISSGHIDGTSLSVEGKYIELEEKESSSEKVKENEENEEDDEPVPIKINHGYSRDYRPDLKQFTLILLTTGEEGIPLFMQVGDGNKLDSQAFPEMIKAFQSQWQGEKLDLFVIDLSENSQPNHSKLLQLFLEILPSA